MRQSIDMGIAPAAVHQLETERLSPEFYSQFEAVQVSSDDAVQPAVFVHTEVQAKWAAYLEIQEWDPEMALQIIREAKVIHIASGGARSLHLETSEAIELVRLHRLQEAAEVADNSLNAPGFDQFSTTQQRRLLVNAAFVALEQSDFAKADNLYGQAFQRDPESLPILANWALVKLRRGDLEEARELVEQLQLVIADHPEKQLQWENKKDKYPELKELSMSEQ